MNTIQSTQQAGQEIKLLASQLKTLHDGDLYRSGHVVTSVFGKIIQGIVDWWFGGKEACDQRAFRELCNNNHLAAEIGRLNSLVSDHFSKSSTDSEGELFFDAIDHPNESKLLLEMAQKAKWLLKIKAHLIASGMYDSAMKAEDTKALYNSIFGTELEKICKSLDTEIDLSWTAFTEAEQSTLTRALRWIQVAPNLKKLLIAGEFGQVPFETKDLVSGSIMLYDPLRRSKIQSLLERRLGEKSDRAPIHHTWIKTEDNKGVHIGRPQDALGRYKGSFPNSAAMEDEQYGDLVDYTILEPLPSLQPIIDEKVVPQLQAANTLCASSFLQIIRDTIAYPFRWFSRTQNQMDLLRSYSADGLIATAYHTSGIQIVGDKNPEYARANDYMKSPYLQPVFAANPKLRESQKQDPQTLSGVLNILWQRNLLTVGEFEALKGALNSKKAFRELSIQCLVRLDISESEKKDCMSLLQNNRFHDCFTILERISRLGVQSSNARRQEAVQATQASTVSVPVTGELESQDPSIRAISDWVRRLPHVGSKGQFTILTNLILQALKANDSERVHAFLLGYCNQVIALREENASRNDLYYVHALSLELAKLPANQTIAFLDQLLLRDLQGANMSELLRTFVVAVEASHGSTGSLAQMFDAMNGRYGLTLDANDLDKSIASMAKTANFFLEQYEHQYGRDWFYFFYYGEILESFKELSSHFHNHKWCGQCHHPDGRAEGVSFPSTMDKDAPFQRENQITGVTKRPVVPAKEQREGSVMICTCSFGTGHTTAASGIASSALEHGLHATIVDNSMDTFLSASPLHIIGKNLGQDWDCPKVFNWIIRTENYWLNDGMRSFMDGIYSILGLRGIHGVAGYIDDNLVKDRQLFMRKLMVHRPDSVVTTYHMDLNIVRACCKDLAIPVIHLPTDMGMKMNEPFKGYPVPDAKEDLMVGIPYRDPKVKQTAAPLPESRVFEAGYPIRREFLDQYTPEQIHEFKTKKGIADKKVVVVMTGGGGINVPYPEMLANDEDITTPLHIVVVAGNNTEFANDLKRKLRTVTVTGRNPDDSVTTHTYLQGKNRNVTIELAQEENPNQNTPYRLGPKTLSFWESVSDAIITKPGGASTAEALYKKRKMIFNTHQRVFEWEAFNIACIKKWGYGWTFDSLKGLRAKVMEAVNTTVDGDLDKVLIDPANITNAILDAVERSQAQFA